VAIAGTDRSVKAIADFVSCIGDSVDLGQTINTMQLPMNCCGEDQKVHHPIPLSLFT
jgi:hypothetical protein